MDRETSRLPFPALRERGLIDVGILSADEDLRKRKKENLRAWTAYSNIPTLPKGQPYPLKIDKRISMCKHKNELNFADKRYDAFKSPECLWILAVSDDDQRAMDDAGMYYGIGSDRSKLAFFLTAPDPDFGDANIIIDMNDKSLINAAIQHIPFIRDTIVNGKVTLYSKFNYKDCTATTNADGRLMYTECTDPGTVIRQYYARIGKPKMFAIMLNSIRNVAYGI